MENDQSKIVLVVGSTGLLGMEICRKLIEAKKQVRGLVRTSSDPTKVAALRQMGVETVVGDIKDSSSLENACGVETIISTASSTFSRQEGDSIETVDNTGQLNLVDAAKSCNVKRFVFISFNPNPIDFPLQTAKRSVEKRLKQSGMTYTILQPTFFMEVWLSPAVGFDYPNAKANIFGEGRNKISYISMSDVAAFAVAALDSAQAENAVIELGGPEALTPLEVVEIFEKQNGKPFAINFVPEEALDEQYKTAPDSLSKSFAALMISSAEGSAIDMVKVAENFAIRLTSVKEYAQKM